MLLQSRAIRSYKSPLLLALIGYAIAIPATAAPTNVDSFNDMFAQGTTDGYLRTAYHANSHDQFNDFGAGSGYAWSYGGELNFTTARFHGFNLRLGADAQRNITQRDDHGVKKGIRDLNANVSAVGEAYIQWADAINSNSDARLQIRAGNQKLNDSIPFAGTYNWYIVPQIYQGVTTFYGTEDNNIQAMRIYRFKSKTSSTYEKGNNVVGKGNLNSAEEYDVDGFWALGAHGATHLDNFKLSGRAWWFDYKDIAHLTYLDTRLKHEGETVSPFIALQYITEKESGDKLYRKVFGAGEKIDSQVFGVQLGMDLPGWTAALNYNHFSTGDKNSDAGLVAPYADSVSSDPLFAQPFLNSTQDLGNRGNAYSIEAYTYAIDNTFIGMKYSRMDLKPRGNSHSIKQNEYLLFGTYNFQGVLAGWSFTDEFAYQTRSPKFDRGRDYVENRLTINYSF